MTLCNIGNYSILIIKNGKVMVEEVKVFSYSMKYLNQSTYLELRMNPVSEQTTPKTPLLTPKYKVGIESGRYEMDAQRLKNNKTSSFLP